MTPRPLSPLSHGGQSPDNSPHHTLTHSTLTALSEAFLTLTGCNPRSPGPEGSGIHVTEHGPVLTPLAPPCPH